MTEKITVIKNDEAYIHLEASPAILKELWEIFSFLAPGHQYAEAFKKKKWDGYIHLLKSNGSLYRGLLPWVEKYAQDNKYEIQVDPELVLKNNFSLIEGEEFSKTLGLPFEARDYQINAFVKAIRDKRTLLMSPTASGKSLIIYMITHWIIKNHDKSGVIIVPTTTLVEQLYSDFASYGMDVDNHVHRVYSGMEKYTDKPIVITTWQTLYTMPERYLKTIGWVIGDEAHTFKAKSLIYLMTHMTNTKYRIGTTGTIDNNKNNKMVLQGLFGPIREVITTKELMDRKQIANLNIKCLLLSYPEPVRKNHHDFRNFPDEVEFLNGFLPRNRFICNLAISLHGNTMILYQRIKGHGKLLYDLIQEKAEPGRKVYFVHGGVDTLERERIRKEIEGETNAIAVVSYGTFSTGTNIKNINNLIFASDTKSKIRSLQSVGRGLRIGDSNDLTLDNENVTLYDVVDDLSYKKKDNYALSHFRERIEIYNSQKFSYKIYKIEVKDG